jgi:hypothetical protein
LFHTSIRQINSKLVSLKCKKAINFRCFSVIYLTKSEKVVSLLPVLYSKKWVQEVVVFGELRLVGLDRSWDVCERRRLVSPFGVWDLSNESVPEQVNMWRRPGARGGGSYLWMPYLPFC